MTKLIIYPEETLDRRYERVLRDVFDAAHDKPTNLRWCEFSEEWVVSTNAENYEISENPWMVY